MIDFVGCVDQTCDEDLNLNISMDYIHKWTIKRTYHQGIIDFQTLSSGSQRHQMSFLMVGKTWIHVSYD
jgi:hypothetical protein